MAFAMSNSAFSILIRRVVLIAVTSVFPFGHAATVYATLSTITLFSSSNNKNLSFQLYTPPGYTTDTTREYPVVISLHGIGGTSSQRANIYGPLLDARINAAEILPMIWIFPDGQTDSFYGDAYNGSKQVHSQIMFEQLPYVDANYPTIADSNHHAMEGFSMGGFGAAMYTAKHPELFSAVVEYAGALSTWQNLVQFNNTVAVNMYNSVEANFVPYSLWDQTDAHAAALATQVNYKMIVGDADTQYNSNVRFRDHLLGLGVDPHFQVLPGVQHIQSSYAVDGTGIRYLSDHFSAGFRSAGDYDQNGAVNAFDYNSWRAARGSTTQLAADGNGNGLVDAADYVIWRDRMTTNGAASDVSGVPEPATFALASAVATASLLAILRPARNTPQARRPLEAAAPAFRLSRS
jgi:enterochelin esterase-like enzyme